MKKVILFLSMLALIVNSYGQTTKKSIAAAEKITCAELFSIADKEDIDWFGEPVFPEYECEFIESTDEANWYNNQFFFKESSKEDKRYGFKFFIFPKNPDYKSVIFLIDSISIGSGVYSLLFSYWNYDQVKNGKYKDVQGWIVNYSSDNKYIDSRMIYRNAKIDNMTFKVNSNLDLPEKKFVIFDNKISSNLAYPEIPIIIHTDGTFEEFPDIPFEQTDIAMSNCHSNGLFGKFPLKQKWTLLSFNWNYIANVETKRNYHDWVGNPSTLFVNRWEEHIWFDIAFKGFYTKADIKILPLLVENNDSIVNLIKQNLPKEDNFDFKQTEVIDVKLRSFTNNKNKFWIAYYTFKRKNSRDLDTYACVLGVTPDNKVVFLANHCPHYEKPIYILQLKNDFYLYPNGVHCGEGAVGGADLYKLTTDFEKIFNDSIVCD